MSDPSENTQEPENPNLKLWNKVCQPPAAALKQISGGRISGKTDINPQWRLKAMTESFGPIGTGWKYTIEKLWTEPGAAGEVCAFALVNVYVLDGLGTGGWSEPIPGIGGNMLVEKESAGLHTSDEAFKMAVTDALSVALKALGVAADIYAGLWDGSKYQEKPATTRRNQRNAEDSEARSGAAQPLHPVSDDPDTFVITFGKKHPGESLGEIGAPKEEGGQGDRGYLHYLQDNIAGSEQAGEKLSPRDLELKDVLARYFEKHPSQNQQG